ncbi:MAG: hypothetical protein Q7R32_03645, partial [Dehalococcoidia bacterium]|nr:hypothetical protein [Dehalococcoidia bacterium]
MSRRSASPDCDTRVDALLAGLRDSVEGGGQHWFVAVLQAAGDWPVAEEEVDGRRYRYLIGGEAFDWLLLAERLCEAVADLTSEDEREALLLHARFPIEVTEEEFRRLLGPAKHRAHLNFLYGVQVEEALQLGVAQEVQKERLSKVWENGHVDEEVCQRIYGASRRELFERFRRQSDFPGEGLTLSDLHEFTYWLFKHRVNNSDPARVASDTRKGLAMLSRLRAGRA